MQYLLTVLESGDAIETANIAREGAFGLFAAMYKVAFCCANSTAPLTGD
jgi:hypothetical protein